MSRVPEAWVAGARRLAAAGIESPRLDARLLLAHAMNLASDELLSSRDASPEELAQYAELLERRAAREPAAYIVGEREFWSLPFAVGPGVLVPRPETETLVEEALGAFPDRERPFEVLDLGTGSGCLLISFLVHRPAARGTGVDLSPDALVWARRNAVTLGVSARTRWHQGGWAAAGQQRFDVVFANPPYLAEPEGASLAPEIRLHEPPLALFGGTDGLEAYHALAPVLAASLSPGGQAFVELGSGQAPAVSEIFGRAGLEILRTVADLSGVLRCMVAGRAGTAP